jgi:hypothetical protein
MPEDQKVNLKIHFDPATKAALDKREELVTISVMYYGEPKPGYEAAADEMGQIYLGWEEYTIWPKDQSFAIGSSLGPAAPLDSVLVAMVNLNVFSARISDENNLLDCSFIDGPVKELSAEPQALYCKLIGG